MEDLVLLLMTFNVLAVSAAVIYYAAHADYLWPFERSADRGTTAPEPSEVLTAAEWGSYVRGGLEDLAVMLAQAARKRH